MEMKEAADAFSALAQGTRLEALRLLVAKGPAGIQAGELAAQLAIAPPTLSFHLKELSNAGLVLSRKEGRSVIYVADYAGIRAIVDFLMADCCQGDPRLCGPYIIKEQAAC